MNQNGTGLGLYICKQIAQSCGGKIWVKRSILWAQNKKLHGTTFVFTMLLEPMEKP
jgi:signal transduction histidine kinase